MKENYYLKANAYTVQVRAKQSSPGRMKIVPEFREKSSGINERRFARCIN